MDETSNTAVDGGDLNTGGRPPARTTLGNENLQSDAVKAEKEKQEQAARALLPVSTVVKEFIEKERKNIKDYHSYLSTLFLRKNGKQPTKEDIEFEFRAREMYLAFLDRFHNDVDAKINSLKSAIPQTPKDENEQ